MPENNAAYFSLLSSFQQFALAAQVNDETSFRLRMIPGMQTPTMIGPQ